MVGPTALAQIATGATLLASVLLLAIAAAVHFRERLPGLAAVLVTFALVGYAIGNRAFAYIGLAPIFVGELLLVSLVIAAIMAGRPARVVGSRAAVALLAFAAIGTITTLPYIPVYGLDSLRDAVLWGYGAIAIAILALATENMVNRVLIIYARCIPVFLLIVSLMLLIELFTPVLAGAVVFKEIPVLIPKHGDVAVHLAGIGAFLAVGLHKVKGVNWSRYPAVEWVIWGMWMGCYVLISDSRGGMLSVLTAVLLVWVLGRGRVRVWKPSTLAIIGITLASLLPLQVGIDGSNRALSIGEIAHRLQSTFTTTGDLYVDGTREWRLQWWGDILDYTIAGPYRWLGKGYGVNLADDDGFQVWEDGSLRSPHNAHLTVLARSGVLGLGAWLLFLMALLIPLLRLATGADRSNGRNREAALWLLGYMLASLINATFDVYLEGPQGGIWFWSMAGLAMVMTLPTEVIMRSPASNRLGVFKQG